jgi:hypothetical protein
MTCTRLRIGICYVLTLLTIKAFKRMILYILIFTLVQLFTGIVKVKC